MMRMGKFEKWWERGGEKDLGIYVQRERERGKDACIWDPHATSKGENYF
jgi:hypothetical protein